MWKKILSFIVRVLGEQAMTEVVKQLEKDKKS
jgi:hypothetical protein